MTISRNGNSSFTILINGVTHKIILAVWLALAVPICAADIRADGYVIDQAGILSSKDTAYLSRLSHHLDQSAQVQVVTLVVRTLPQQSIEEFANRTFERLGIGHKGSDKGVLLVTAVTDRKVRIEVGYGLEAIIPDGRAGGIIDRDMLPHFQSNDIRAGVIHGHHAVSKILADKFQVSMAAPSAVPAARRTGSTWLPFVLFFVLAGILSRRRGGGWWIFLLLLLSGGGRSGGFGSFGGGGFGGFGGGASGGGGASRSW